MELHGTQNILQWNTQRFQVLRLLGGLDESSLRAGLLLQAQVGPEISHFW
jgi:hypothetical protein